MKKQIELGKLAKTEESVMNVVWELATPVTVSKLLEVFYNEKEWKTSTMSTILTRLIEKGFLKKKIIGKANVYNAVITKSEYQKYETKNFINNIYGGSVKNFIASIIDDDNIDLEDVAELRKWFLTKSKEDKTGGVS